MPLTATCHCGATRIEVAEPPSGITECNCTFCFKRGALWAYYPPEQVAVHAEHGTGYTSDPRQHTHYHCSVCGCSTHSVVNCTWTEAGPDFSRPRVSVNARLLEDHALVTALPVTKLDGRNDW